MQKRNEFIFIDIYPHNSITPESWQMKSKKWNTNCIKHADRLLCKTEYNLMLLKKLILNFAWNKKHFATDIINF